MCTAGSVGGSVGARMTESQSDEIQLGSQERQHFTATATAQLRITAGEIRNYARR
jgi:hypothetical protein